MKFMLVYMYLQRSEITLNIPFSHNVLSFVYKYIHLKNILVYFLDKIFVESLNIQEKRVSGYNFCPGLAENAGSITASIFVFIEEYINVKYIISDKT